MSYSPNVSDVSLSGWGGLLWESKWYLADAEDETHKPPRGSSVPSGPPTLCSPGMAYINRQSGVCSAAILNACEKNLWLWALEHVLSLWAFYVPGVENRLRLSDKTSLGVDAFTNVPWPKEPLYAFPSLHLITPLLERLRLEQLSIMSVSRDDQDVGGPAVNSPPVHGSPVSGRGAYRLPAYPGPAPSGSGS